jgi:hypothetical protein
MSYVRDCFPAESRRRDSSAGNGTDNDLHRFLSNARAEVFGPGIASIETDTESHDEQITASSNTRACTGWRTKGKAIAGIFDTSAPSTEFPASAATKFRVYQLPQYTSLWPAANLDGAGCRWRKARLAQTWQWRLRVT